MYARSLRCLLCSVMSVQLQITFKRSQFACCNLAYLSFLSAFRGSHFLNIFLLLIPDIISGLLAYQLDVSKLFFLIRTLILKGLVGPPAPVLQAGRKEWKPLRENINKGRSYSSMQRWEEEKERENSNEWRGKK